MKQLGYFVSMEIGKLHFVQVVLMEVLHGLQKFLVLHWDVIAAV
jgi:hypothetical protein